MTRAIFTSKSCEYSTPDWLFYRLNREFGFDLDVCASKLNHKCDNYYTIIDDGLSKPWDAKNIWMNPPYGREIEMWIERAYLEGQNWNGKKVVALIPVRACTKWWHLYVMQAAEIRFILGRLYFKGGSAHAPFSSCVVIFKDHVGPTIIKTLKREGGE